MLESKQENVSVQEFQKRIDDLVENTNLKSEYIKTLEEEVDILKRLSAFHKDQIEMLRYHIKELNVLLKKSMTQTDEVIEIAQKTLIKKYNIILES